MSSIGRLTTPTHTFTLPVGLDETKVAKIKVVYAQNGSPVVKNGKTK